MPLKIWTIIAVVAALALRTTATHASPIHPDVLEAREALRTARGPEVYASLRRVWGTWDRADPAHVEAVLREAAQSPKLRPPEQVYARLLIAYARLRRGDLVAARDTMHALGYIDQWNIVGPFDDEGKAGLGTEYAPELELGEPIVPGRAYSGKERPVRYRAIPNAFHYGYVDTGSLLRPDQRVCAYLRTFVSDPDAKRARPASLWVGVGGAYRVFWNGAPVMEDKAYRGYDAERSAGLVLVQPGQNDLTIKVCGDDRAPIVAVRVANAKGGPDPRLVARSDVSLSEAAAETVRAETPRANKSPLRGPLEAFEALTSKKGASPKDLEAHARYLVATGSDDPTAHQARDLAVRAAEEAPTVERALLAASLAEDHNQQARWLERAEDLVPRGEVNVDVLVARAAHVAEGLSPQESIRFYDQILAVDRDNLQAIRGRVELYNRAGLRRSALAVLQAAVERNPDSVTLLNMYASELGALGRTTESAEVQARYVARRFRDPSYASQMIELSIARRNAAATTRWIDRFVAADPDSQWGLGLAARAHRALGQPERAVAILDQALELAPEDVSTLRAYADLRGVLGDRTGQLALLQKIRQVMPQDKDVREYVEYLEPSSRRADEKYAWKADEFLKLRHVPAAGENKRTLVDLTVSTVFENGLSSKFRQVVFQPLTDAAAALARQYAFQYQADRQSVRLRGARVYRSDGSTDEATESGEGAANNPAIAMYTSARTFYVQFPRLEPGDVVELRYRIDDIGTKNEMADYFGEITYLQASEPTLRADYVLVTPKSRKMYIDTRGIPNLERSVTEQAEQRIYRFSASDVPAVTPEPSMPPWPSVLGFVHVSTFGSWEEMGTWYWGLAKDQFDLDDQTRALARDLAKGKTTVEEKVTAVFDWVVQNTRYVALEFGIYGYKPRRCVQTVSRGWGDCKDKATVIVSLLRELGIEATIVIVRSGLRGDFESNVASLAPFDHAIAYVPALDRYLDGTAEYAGASELPGMDLGALALRINEGKSKLVRLPFADAKANVRRRRVQATLGHDGSARDLRVAYDTRGVHAPGFRRRFAAEATRRERLIEDLAREFGGFELDTGPASVVTGDLDDIEAPVSIQVRGKAPRFARKEGDRLGAPVTPGFRLTPQYASLSSRKLPVALPPIGTLEDEFVVKLPAGLRAARLPELVRIESRFGSLEIHATESGDRVTVKTRLVIVTRRIEPKDYGEWKKFCSDVDHALDVRLGVEPT